MVQHEPCSIGRAMEVLGERWTFLIVREAFFGVRRFTELQRNLGIARNILSARLQTLTRAGILERIRYQAEPERYEYKLTARGRDLYPAIVSIMKWGDEYLAGDAGPPLLLFHQECGHHAEPTLVCSHCREPLDPRKVTPEPGPGAAASVHASRN
jgi:DNA-binding HxlR family transcriptional regulator